MFSFEAAVGPSPEQKDLEKIDPKQTESDQTDPEQIMKSFENIKDPEVIQKMLEALTKRADAILGNTGKQLENTEEKEAGAEGKDNEENIIEEKRRRLDEVRHGITELVDRMQRPYVVSAELGAVKEVLDILAFNGDCNSIILEGEPGTGKTQWAYAEAGREIQEGEDVSLIHVRVKETMTAQDMLYVVDDIRRLSDAQAKAQIPEEMKKEALEWRNKILSGEVKTNDEEYVEFNGRMKAIVELSEVAKDLDYSKYIDLGQLGEAIYQSGKGKKVYLLIDEIEKGREELMNGILDEIENLTFTINETGEVIKGDKRNLRIIITTNPEDSDKIPSSFRRRSLYHFMSSPERADLAKIVELNFPEIREDLLGYALDVFYRYKNHPEIEKSPSTPELLAWIRVLSENGLGGVPDDIPYKEVLLKYKEDRDLDIGIESAKGGNKEVPDQMPLAIYKAFHEQQVFRMDSSINDPDGDESQFEQLYLELEQAGIRFNTPFFREEEYEDRSGYDETRRVLARPFQIIEPGVESLGDGCFVVEGNALAKMGDCRIFHDEVKVISQAVEFKSIKSKNQEFTTGTISFEGKDVLAYRRNSDEKVVFFSELYQQ